MTSTGNEVDEGEKIVICRFEFLFCCRIDGDPCPGAGLPSRILLLSALHPRSVPEEDPLGRPGERPAVEQGAVPVQP